MLMFFRQFLGEVDEGELVCLLVGKGVLLEEMQLSVVLADDGSVG